MLRIIISGANGYMGQVVAKIAQEDPDVTVVCGVDKFTDTFKNDFPVYETFNDIVEQADVIIDFSRPDALAPIVEFAKEKNVAAVLCTTGYTKEDKDYIKTMASDATLFQSANMSLGVNIQMDLIGQAAEFLGHDYNIEIIEKHHNRKVDAPSGTALALADALNDAFTDDMNYVYGRHTTEDRRDKLDIGIHAVRGGTVVGEHEVIFYGNDEIISVEHRALSRHVFASGAIRAAKFLKGKPAKLYDMKDIISEQHAITNMYLDKGQIMICVSYVPHTSKTIASLFTSLAESGVNIDIITQTPPTDGLAHVSFTLSDKSEEKAVTTMNKFLAENADAQLNISKNMTKITVEGMGMERQSGVAAKLFEELAKHEIEIKTISTSETKIAFCIESENAEKSFSVISNAYNI